MEKLTKARNNLLTTLVIIILGLVIFDVTYVVLLRKSRKSEVNLNYVLNKIVKTNNVNDSLSFLQVEQKFIFEQNFINDVCDTLFNNSSKLIFLFGENTCSQCIIENIMDLNLLSDKIGADKIILVGDFVSKKSFEIFLEQLEYDGYKHLILQEFINVSSLKLDIPMFFIEVV